MKLPLAETISAIILVVIILLLGNYEPLLMPKSADAMLLTIFVVAYLVFAATIWKESPSDERENLHRLEANRVAFIVGSTLAVIGIVQQTLEHNIDIWLMGVLTTMVSGKVVSRIISQWRN